MVWIVLGALSVMLSGVGLTFRVLDRSGLADRLQAVVSPVREGDQFDNPVWPPAPGAPRDDFFGEVYDQPIEVPTAANAFHPLRRRRIDPWIELSNARIETGPDGMQTLLVDYQVIEGRSEPIALYAMVVDSGTAWPKPLTIPHGESAHPQKPIEIRLRRPPVGNPIIRPLTDCEVYLTVWDSQHVNVIQQGNRVSQGPAAFKVSNSVTVGDVAQVTNAREWRESEFALLSGAAPSATPAEVAPSTEPVAPDVPPEGFLLPGWEEESADRMPQEPVPAAPLDGKRRSVFTSMPVAEEWRFEIDEDVREPSSQIIPLPPMQSSFEAITGIVADFGCRWAAIGYQTRPTRQQDSSTRIVLCDVEGANVVGWGTIDGGYRPVGLINNGRQLVVQSIEGARSTQVELWTLASNGIRRESVWSPHFGRRGAPADLEFCLVLDDEQVVTAANFDTSLLIWNVRSGEALFEFPMSRRCRPAVSPDGRWLAFCSRGEVGIWDIAGQKLAASLPADEIPQSSFGFSPGSEKLVLAGHNRMYVWDFATGTRTHDLVVNAGGPVLVPHADYLMFGENRGAGAKLYDLELQVPVWEFPALKFAVAGSQLLAVAEEEQRSSLILTPMPYASLTAALAVAASDPELKIVHPGATVEIEFAGVDDPQRQAGLVAILEQKLAHLGVSVVDSADVKFVVSVTRVTPHEIEIHSGPYAPLRGTVGSVLSGEVIRKTVAESVCSLSVEYQGQSVWKTGFKSWIPTRISLQRDETIDGALARLTAPRYEFFETVRIPRSILRPRDGQLTLGSSSPTVEGFQ